MRIVATGYGDPSMLEQVRQDLRAPSRGEVMVSVRAAGVNPVDTKRYTDPDYATSHGGSDPDFPIGLGVEAAGVVTAVGEDAHGPAGPIVVGDEVIAYRVDGAYATDLVVKATDIVPKPTTLSWEQAGSMMLTGTTAWHTLRAVRARAGQTVLVHGASGGVGRCVLQLAALQGVRVIGTGSERTFDEISGWGAIPVQYGTGLEGRVRAAAPDGVAAAIDLVGTEEAIDVSLSVVADPARIATIVAFERAKDAGIQTLGGSPGQDERGRAIREEARLPLTWLAQAGAYEVTVSRTFPLAEAEEAHRAVLAGGAGRLVLSAGDAAVNRPQQAATS